LSDLKGAAFGVTFVLTGWHNHTFAQEENRENAMRILIADDNDDFLSVLEELVKGQGHTPMIARDGKQAREFLQDQSVDVIISDVFMPTLDGVRFHSYVREFMGDRDLPFIFMSGYDDPYTQEALENSSADFFISKMAPIGEVIGLLEKIKASLPA
jgi:CheY-like chemotaxis protein